MPTTKSIPVKDLVIDLSNFRTVKQTSELNAIKAMIAISPGHFWALTESLATDGYLPTDTVIVLKSGAKAATLLVKEGNRRVAAMKILLNLIETDDLGIPASTLAIIGSIDATWRAENSQLPCAVFEPADAALVDRIVTRAHGKGEKAGRDQWNPVARARHNRDVNKKSEAGLDLLEKVFG